MVVFDAAVRSVDECWLSVCVYVVVGIRVWLWEGDQDIKLCGWLVVVMVGGVGGGGGRGVFCFFF